ncbi:MAG: hypothetical protein KDA88_25075, partial [Planctomycetaceae bacterium]|nr:hypothetical protein [Planctomycetaceae bacterium]
MGQVIGESDDRAAVPSDQKVTSSEVFATIMHQLIDIPQLRLRTDLPADILRAITSTTPIPQFA